MNYFLSTIKYAIGITMLIIGVSTIPMYGAIKRYKSRSATYHTHRNSRTNHPYSRCCSSRPRSYGPYPVINWDPFFFNGYPYAYPFSYYYPAIGFSFGFNAGI